MSSFLLALLLCCMSNWSAGIPKKVSGLGFVVVFVRFVGFELDVKWEVIAVAVVGIEMEQLVQF